MALTRWNPFAEFEQILDRYNRMFNEGVAALPAQSDNQELKQIDWRPAVDIEETDEAFLIRAELPGVKKDDIKVTVDNGVLTIQGERKLEKEEKDKKRHRIERVYGSFLRSFTLPDNVNQEDIRADYQDGVLTLHLNKVEPAKPKAIEVKVN
ncbi:Hsp20/alpha crystallin family protein [Hahella sp. SMD15-11]|uniref:Hsp20/alpha crystallin family protein n=1 Tax=Thermohahella caldifontis TaxID=3142973 RepID=A0AB39UT98_9GAMM